MREVTDVPVEQPLRRVLNRTDISKTVEHRKGIAVLQSSQGTIYQRCLRLDLVFGPDVDVRSAVMSVRLEFARSVRHSKLRFSSEEHLSCKGAQAHFRPRQDCGLRKSFPLTPALHTRERYRRIGREECDRYRR